MKRVLLTGATGFVGRNAIPYLINGGYEVHAVSTHAAKQERGVHWHSVDLLDELQVARLLNEVRPSHLLHFAWYAEHGKFWKSPENFRWLAASIALLRHFHATGGQRVVMAGTCAEYDWNYGYCTEAITPCYPATPYGVCKNALQDVLRVYGVEEKLSSAWGRIFFLYGPQENPARLVASVANALLRGEVARCSHGKQLRDFMHVEDVASAFVSLLNSPVEGAVNISSGLPVSLRDVITTVAGYVGAGELVQFGVLPVATNDPPLLVGNNRRLLQEVGWHPQYSLHDGIVQTINWWNHNKGKLEHEISN